MELNKKKPRPKCPSTSWVLIGLLKGDYAFIAKRPSPYRKTEWCLYDGKASPNRYISKKANLAIQDMLKEDKHGRFTLDLRKVRRLRGNHNFKKLYKRLKNQRHEKRDRVQEVQV